MKKHVATITIKGATKRVAPSFRRGVEFIAYNLDVGESIDETKGDIAVIAIAEAFGKEPEDVAAAVWRMRDREKREERRREKTAARVRAHRARKAGADSSTANNAQPAPSTGAKGE